ncbi:hypothetical protein [Qipengyuania sp. JC766]|uniref:hypothetical protein n=1 Tax=Qipengyuania sp. JC766 TaxID=3232139 RepID=UPI0034585496
METGQDEHRVELAVRRIEEALARISAAAEKTPAAVPASISAFVEKHESLRETVATNLRALDELIAELEP